MTSDDSHGTIAVDGVDRRGLIAGGASDTNPTRLPACHRFVTGKILGAKNGLPEIRRKSLREKKYRRGDLNPHDLAVTGF